MPRSLVHVLLAASLSVSAVSLAEPKKSDKLEAKTAYEAGIQEFGDGKYDEAARDFSRAYYLVGEPGILYNVAQSYRLAQRFGDAAKAYREFLSHLPKDAPSRAEIEGRIAELDERAADAERRADRARTEPKRQLPVPHVAEKPPVRRTGTLEIVGYSLVGVTIAGLASGIALSVLAGRASSDVQSAAAAHETFGIALDDTQSRGKTYDRVAIAMYVVGGVAAAGAGVAIGLGRPKRRPERIAVVPLVTPQGGALVVGGRF